MLHYDFDTGTTNDTFYNKNSLVRKLRETSSAGNELVTYDYSGAGSQPVTDLVEPDIKLDLEGGTSGTYSGVDRYGRTKQQYWNGYNTTGEIDRFNYVYDNNSQLTSREFALTGTNPDKDQAYTFGANGLGMMTAYDEGDLVSGSISGTPGQEQDLTYDAIGNWVTQILKTAGTTDLDQDRTVNDANEITNITETTGPSWVTPAYDATGMT